ncbi:MAG: glycoside hydrolase family 2 protein [Lewinellaceae bacterium]|nr:glycoside hydrolase family 2 protein [Lewinellaceae bacterium]
MQHVITISVRSILPFLLVICWCIGCTQPDASALEWPEITQTAKPWSRWWWHGSSVTKAGITAELAAYQKAGLGGLELTPIYGVIGDEEHFVNYLSPEWMDLFEFTLQEAERLGLGIDMATGTGWPFGGPWVSEADACKYMAHKEYALKGGERLSEPVRFTQEPFVRAVPNQVYQLYGMYKEKGEKVTGSLGDPALQAGRKGLETGDLVEPVSANKNLQALALDQVRFEKSLPLQVLMAYSDKGEVLNLSEKVDRDGRLNWTAPEGAWTLYAVFQGWHGKMVERAAPGGEGNVIDHFSATSIRNYLARFEEAFKGRKTAGLRAFFNDSYEVDDARGQADWTPDLFDAFLRLRGYDLRQHLPALFGKDSEENNIRVLSDYRETVSDLLLETFTNEWGAWARKKGAIIRNQAHGSPANILDLYAASDIPETEGTDIVRIKFASSAAHVTGKKLASSESATWLNEHFLSNLSEIRENLDRYLAGGVNHVFYHGTCYSPPDDPWPGRLFYAAVHANPRNSLWRDFPALNQYVARTQAFLQAGKSDNDMLLYFPVYDRFAHPEREMLEHFDGSGRGRENTPVRDIADTLQALGYGFDFISDRQMLSIDVKDGALTGAAQQYRTIVIPECRFMPLPTMEKLLDLARNGATVIFHRSLPEDVPGLGDLQQRRADFQKILGSLKFDDKGIAAVGKGRFLVNDNLLSMTDQAGISRETFVDQGLNYTRRDYGGGKYYFITNWSENDLDDWISLQSPCKSVAIFDPMTGKAGFAQTGKAPGKGAIGVCLQLNRGASCILKTFDSETGGTPWQYVQKSGEPFALNGAWKLEFIEGGPELPAAAEMKTLDSWTELEGDAVKQFSGTARYSLAFPMPEGKGREWLLDLGRVAESAHVRINGQEAGVVLGPVYQVTLDRNLLRENNLLEIEVSNLMANRIAGMDKAGVFWKKFYNVNFPARRNENRGKNGLFDASGWEPRPSGLIGPVTLTMLE